MPGMEGDRAPTACEPRGSRQGLGHVQSSTRFARCRAVRLTTQPRSPTFQCASLVLAEAAANTVLATSRFARESPVQAGFLDGTGSADSFGQLGLCERGTGGANGEEELGILCPAGSAVTPGHDGHRRDYLSVRALRTCPAFL